MIWHVAGGFLILATLPGILELLLLTIGAALSKVKKPSLKKNNLPTAIIIPAYNEEAGIQRTINNLKKCTGTYEIIVIADNCTDQTSNIAKECGVRVIERNDKSNPGKHKALQYAFQILLNENFEIYIVIDADSIAYANLVEVVQNEIASGADAVQVFDGVLNSTGSNKLRMMKISYLAFNLVRPLGRQFWGMSCGLFGNGMAFSKATLQSVPFKTESSVEDLAYHLSLVEAGKKVRFNPQSSVLAEMPSKHRIMAIQRVRWEGGRFKTAIKEIPKCFISALKGNLRLIEPLLDLLTLPLSYLIISFIIVSFIPMTFALPYAIFGISAVIFHIIVSMIIGKCGPRDYLSLAFVPFYLIWKILLSFKIVQNVFQGNPWTRTERKPHE